VLTFWMIKLLFIHFYSFTEEERQACFVPPTVYNCKHTWVVQWL
jgi:hypothetical protein